MKLILTLALFFFAALGYAKCPSGIYSAGEDEPFYKFEVDRSNSLYLIFCGYSGKESKGIIETSEYDIFLVDSNELPSKDEPILAFGAVDETVIYKEKTSLIIKDIWGGFTYKFDTNNLGFEKIFSYEPNAISESDFKALVKKIKNGKMDYTWPWLVLDATILGYPDSVKLLLNLPNLDGAASEEYSKAMKVYEAYKLNNGI